MTQPQNDDDPKADISSQEAPKATHGLAFGRDKNGRFEKGFTGNKKGRPRKPERAWSNRQSNTDILLEANAEVAVTRNGKTELVPMRTLIIRQLLIKAAKSDNLRQIIAALGFIDRAQSNRESKDWEFYKDLERIESLFEEECEIFPEANVPALRDNWRKRSRKT